MIHEFNNINDFLTALKNSVISHNFEIDLTYQKLNTADIQMIAQALESGQCPPELQIHLEGNNLEDASAQAIAQALQSGHCPQGLQIHLGVNNVGTAGAQAIAQALQSEHCPQGVKINLWANKIGAAGAQAIAQALQSGHCPQGLQIDIASNNIEAAGAQAIAQALQSGHCPQGLQINLANNKIGAAGAQAIAQALQSGHCPQGLQINLMGTNIGGAGIQAIAQALQSGHCPQGLQINFRWNNMSGDDAQELAQALQSGHCPQGLQINLGYNKIDAAGVQAIAQALQSGHCPQGLQVDLEYTEISAADFQTIAQALQSGHCPQGLQINLENNLIGAAAAAGAQAIAHVILSGTYPSGLRLQGIGELNNHLKTALITLLPREEILQGSEASSSQTQDNDTHDWPHTFSVIRHIFCFDPNVILADEELTRAIQAALEYYMRSLQHSIEGTVNEEDYRESYFSVLHTISDLILAMYEVSQSAPDNQKHWVSTLMLTLADSILPEQRDNWSNEIYMWARAQRLILIEKAFSLCPDNPSVLARHWQSYCDEFNQVPLKQRSFEQHCELSHIKVNAANASAIEYYYQTRSEGLLELPAVTSHTLPQEFLGELKNPTLLASLSNTDFFKVCLREHNKDSCSAHVVRKPN